MARILRWAGIMHPDIANTLASYPQISRYLAAGGLSRAAGEVAKALGEKPRGQADPAAMLSVVLLKAKRYTHEVG